MEGDRGVLVYELIDPANFDYLDDQNFHSALLEQGVAISTVAGLQSSSSPTGLWAGHQP
jgi:hypothetical protein